MDINQINKEVQNYPETVFDTFDLGLGGYQASALRDQLGVLSNLYGRINRLAANAERLYEEAKVRRDEVESLAWSRTEIKMQITQKKIAVKNIPVQIDNETTTLTKEEKRLTLYKYIHSRAKKSLDEIGKQLDLGRTLLSFDKTELEKMNYA